MKAFFVALFLLLLTSCSPRGDKELLAVLSPDELAYARGVHVVKVGGDANYPPYVFKGEDGKLQGLAVDMLDEAMKRLGMKYEIRMAGTRAEVVRALQNKEVDLTLANRSTPSRPWMSTTQPYVFSHGTIMVPAGTDATKVQRMAAVRGSASITFMRLNYPHVGVVEIETPENCFEVLKVRGADGCLIGREQAFFYFKKLGISQGGYELTKAEFDYFLSFGTHVDNPVLTGILIKGLEAIPLSKRKLILRKWLREPHL